MGNSFENKNILLTGGSGFIGSFMIEYFKSEGASLTILDKTIHSKLPNEKNIRYIQGDLSLLTPVFFIKNEYSYIFHLAGSPNVSTSVENPDHDFISNLHAPFILLESIRKAGWQGRLINFSSAAVYGQPKELPITEDTFMCPISPYGVSKLAFEHYLSVYNKFYNVRSASVRPFSIYGPRQKKQVIFDLLGKININPNLIELFGDGTQMRDFIFITDVVEAAVIIALNAPMQGEAYNVASGNSTSILALFEILTDILGIKPQVRWTGNTQSGYPDKWIVDIYKLKQLGFKPKVDLYSGLKQVINWYKDYENE